MCMPGRPLHEHTVIAAALLDSGAAADDNIPLTTASVLLRSPFLRAPIERASRRKPDVRLRSLREVTVTRRLLELNTAECTVSDSILHAIRRVLGSNAVKRRSVQVGQVIHRRSAEGMWLAAGDANWRHSAGHSTMARRTINFWLSRG